jgi:hypothetical protein
MSASYPRGYADAGGGRGARLRAGDWLSLAATPSFATLALLGGEGICGHSGSGMAPMYALMALFHLPAWLKLISKGDET